MTPPPVPIAEPPFTDLVSLFLDELDADERIDLMIAAQAFVAVFDPELQDEALMAFWRATPGFNAYEREMQRREAA